MTRTAPVVVVVGAETPGNVGTIARAMKNFGLSDLKLVDPPPLGRDSEAYGFAGHAREDVLPNAETVTFDEVVESYHTVGCTAITNEDSRRHVRFPFRTPRELAESLRSVDAPTALVFGREGTIEEGRGFVADEAEGGDSEDGDVEAGRPGADDADGADEVGGPIEADGDDETEGDEDAGIDDLDLGADYPTR